MEACKGDTGSKTRERKQRNTIQIPANKPPQCRRKNFGKVLINRINYHANLNDFLNTNQYGFMPQKGTTEAAMEIKKLRNGWTDKWARHSSDKPRRFRGVRRGLLAKHTERTQSMRLP